MINPGELFREISMRVLGTHGTLIIATAVFMACLSTAIALAAVVAEYVEHTLFMDNICYVSALIITLLACIPLSTAGLGWKTHLLVPSWLTPVTFGTNLIIKAFKRGDRVLYD